VHWITPDLSKIESTSKVQAITGPPAIYFRLLIGEILPIEVTKAIYLDADTLVLGDLTNLWNMGMSGNLVLAVPDAYARAFHLGRLHRGALQKCIRFDSPALYFNAGVLIIDVPGWRKEDVANRSFKLMQDYREDLTFRDQDALNCILRERWGALDLTWNYHELPDCLFLWDREIYSPKEIQEACANPKIVHFIARSKPWMKRCFNLRTEEFHKYLSRTCWPQNALPDQSGITKLVRTLFILPHSRLNQFVWRRHAVTDRAGWKGSMLLLLGTHPWMPVTYPIWQILVWLYFLLFMPIDRRELFSRWRRAKK
jgi:lipopolysaccharide biosynthesis glycosyltransferase